MLTITTHYLGPAKVLSTSPPAPEAPPSEELGNGAKVEVLLPNGDCTEARIALAVPYQPAIGDQVLVISQDSEQAYVIGVLRASSNMMWTIPGDLVIQAPQGSISFSSAKKIRLKSRRLVDIASARVNLRAVRLELATRRLVERIGSAYLWVKELFQVKTRRCRTVADDSYLVKAGRARMKSDGNFNINGQTIHLG